MTVNELAREMNLTAYTGAGTEEVTGCYIGDLLSWVMSRASAGDVWITIMSNVNVAAVAKLTDAACVLLAEGVKPEPELVAKAEAQGVTVLGTGLTAYEAARGLSGLLG